MRKFPLIFTRFVFEGFSPNRNVFCPMASNKGMHASTESAGPAATTNNFAAAAASGLPNTGAETKLCPRFVCSAASLSASAPLIVLADT